MIRFLQSGNKAAKYILGGMLLILCLSMVMYLIPGFGSSPVDVARAGVVASVGGEEIRSDDVNRMVTSTQQQRGYPDMLRPLIAQSVIKQMIEQAEIRYEGDQLGLTASDDEVRDELRTRFGQYFFPGGVWVGQEKYEQTIREGANTTVDAFERQLRQDVVTRKLLTTVVAGIDVAPAEIERAYKEQNTKAKFDYAVITLDDVKKEIKPTDAEIKSYFEKNGARYQNAIPEKRQVRYFVLEERQLPEKVTVLPADLQHYYDAHQEQYRVPDRFKARHILITTSPVAPGGKPDQKAVDAARAKAEDILKQIKAGGDFAELAKKYSQDPGSAAKGGELGWVSKGQFVAEFEKAAMGQEKGQISEPVQSTFGFHIIQTEDKETAHMPTLADLKSKIEPLVKQEKVSAAMIKMAKEAQAAAQSQSMEKAAAKYGVQMVQSNPVARTDSLPGVGQSPELMTDIFNVQSKSGPQLARAAQGYAVFEVTKINPPRTPSLDEIKDRVTNDFKAERASQLLAKKTEELADRAHAEHDLRKAAKELGVLVKSTNLVGRSDTVAELGSMNGAASVALSLQPGQMSGPLTVGQNGAVLEVKERQVPAIDGSDFAKSRDSLRDQLINEKRQQALSLFISNLGDRLQKSGKVKINKSEMDSLTKTSS